MRAQLFLGGLPVLGEDDEGADRLLPLRVRPSDDGRVGHGGVCEKDGLDLRRHHVLAAGDDQLAVPR